MDRATLSRLRELSTVVEIDKSPGSGWQAQPAAAPVGARSELKSISGGKTPHDRSDRTLWSPLAGAESGLFVRVKLGCGPGLVTLAPKAAQSVAFCRLSPRF